MIFGRTPDLEHLAGYGSLDDFLSVYRRKYVNRAGRTGLPLLVAACTNRDPAAKVGIANRLLDDGANAASTAPEGFGVFHALFDNLGHGDDMAAAAALSDRLVRQGADLNHHAPGVEVPLTTLVRNPTRSDEELAPLYDVVFSRRGLAVDLIDDSGAAPWQHAARRSTRRAAAARIDRYRTEIAGLPPRGIPPEDSLTLTARAGSFEDFAARYVSQAAAHIDDQGVPLLVAACSNPDPRAREAIAHRLLDDRAAVTPVTPEHFNALHVLFEQDLHGWDRTAVLVTRLLDAGVDRNLFSPRHGLPISVLVRSKWTDEELLPVYELLLTGGVDLTTKDWLGRDPKENAIRTPGRQRLVMEMMATELENGPAEHLLLFVPDARLCAVSYSVLERRTPAKWLDRRRPVNDDHSGWVIAGEDHDDACINSLDDFAVVDFNVACNIEPLIADVYTLPVGSQLEIVRADERLYLIDDSTGQEVPEADRYVPPLGFPQPVQVR